MTASFEAGWYADNSDPGVERWWDGEAWAADTRPLSSPPATTDGIATAEGADSRKLKRAEKKSAKQAKKAAKTEPSDDASTAEDDSWGLRPDIKAAKSKMGVKFGSGREIKKLVEYISDQETVEVMAAGQYGGGQGLVVQTTARLLFLKDGRMKQTIEDFPISKISSVQWSGAMMTGKLLIFASGNKAEITNIAKQDGKVMADRLRDLISDVPAAAPAPPVAPTQIQTTPASSVADELSKLAELKDSGVLSDEEFAEQKARLLGGG